MVPVYFAYKKFSARGSSEGKGFQGFRLIQLVLQTDPRELKKLQQMVKSLKHLGSSLAQPVCLLEIPSVQATSTSGEPILLQSFSVTSPKCRMRVDDASHITQGALSNPELTRDMIGKFLPSDNDNLMVRELDSQRDDTFSAYIQVRVHHVPLSFYLCLVSYRMFVLCSWLILGLHATICFCQVSSKWWVKGLRGQNSFQGQEKGLRSGTRGFASQQGLGQGHDGKGVPQQNSKGGQGIHSFEAHLSLHRLAFAPKRRLLSKRQTMPLLGLISFGTNFRKHIERIIGSERSFK